MKNCKKCCTKYFKFQSSYGLQTPILGKIFTELTRKINSEADNFKLCSRGPDGYVPVVETEKAILDEKLDCAFTGLSYSFIQNSFYELYTSLPFGIDSDAYITYLFEKGGIESLNAEGKKDGLFFYPMALLPPETGGWFNKEITQPEDFKDVKMRIYGLGRNIIEGLGGQAVFLPQNQIIPAVQKGIINSVEFSTIEIDESVELPKYFKYWYSPSWNQLSTVLYFVCNLKKWNSLSDKTKNLIKLIIKENMYSNYLSSNANQIIYLNKYKSQLREFPDNVLNAMRDTWLTWLQKPENKRTKEEYEKIKLYSEQFYAYDNIMKKNI